MTTLYDTIVADEGSVRETADGYLVARARVSRTGVQQYLGSELGRSDLEIVNVYRSPEAVFGNDAMRSYAHRPMTNDHPAKPVTAATWRDVAVGNTGGDVIRDGEFVAVPLILMDAKAISDWRGGKRELSMGYDAEIVFEDGVAPDGTPYQAVQKSMRMNHLALVDRARGGEHLRIGDGRAPGGIIPSANNPTEGGHHMATEKQVLVDGLTVTTTEQGAQAIEMLQTRLKDAATATTSLNDAHARALQAKADEVSRVTAERDDALSKVLSDADVDARVAERSALVAKAKTVADVDYTGKTPAQIHRTAVTAKLGDAALAGKDDKYAEVRFEILAEDAATGVDPMRKVLMQQDGKPAGDPAKTARAKMIADLGKKE